MVDPATTPLGKMLLDEITPVVMVLCTPLVEESCGKNGISLLQMLSPFCNFSNIDGRFSFFSISVFVSKFSGIQCFWIFEFIVQCLCGQRVISLTGYTSLSYACFTSLIFGIQIQRYYCDYLVNASFVSLEDVNEIPYLLEIILTIYLSCRQGAVDIIRRQVMQEEGNN